MHDNHVALYLKYTASQFFLLNFKQEKQNAILPIERERHTGIF